MTACTWQDTARVNFLTTISDTGSTEKEIRSKHSENGRRKVQKPNVASTYNQYMGGVDLFDQKCASYPYPHKVKKWYHAIFHFIKEAALVNSYILYSLANPASKLSHSMFRRQIAEKLCDQIPKNLYVAKGRKSATQGDELDSRLTERHFSMMYESPSYKPDCVVCSKRGVNQKRKQTRYGCADCKDGRGVPVPMCMPDCFKRYHTLKNYKL